MLMKPTVRKKSKAQALVEFALILTLLLSLIYGILETSRLLFIYATTVTAARQATRYGSATGNNSATPPIPYYKDCAGIRNAAKRIGFLTVFTDANIAITYDNGPGTASLGWTCLPGAAFSGGNAQTGNRIIVCVSTQWNPIIGSLVPLRWSGTRDCSGTVVTNGITKQSERTIISNIAIGVTAVPGAWTGTGNISLAVSASPTTYTTAGQLITYTYTMTNTGSIDLVGVFNLTANNTSTSCGAGYTIYPGLSYTCTGTYSITQADLDAGSVVSLTTATTSGASSNQVTTAIIAAQTARLTIDKEANPTEASVAGTVITYTYTLTNSGNVTLTSPYTVTDNRLGGVPCSSIDALLPGGSTTCTQTYSVSATDITTGYIDNTATGTAKFGSTTVTSSNSATATVDTAALILRIVATPSTATQAGQVIEYKYVIRNNYTSVITGVTVTVTNPKFNVSCPGPIPVGNSVVCIVNYTVTQTDMDTGIAALTNTATARGNSGTLVSRAVTASLPVVQTDALSLTISATTNPASAGFPTVTAVGNTFTFNYMLTNTGNTTLTSLYTISPSTIRDGGAAPLHTALTVTCGTGDLLPGASTTANFCTSTAISVTANDLNNTYGSYYITNLATANAKTKVGTRAVVSAQQTGVVATVNAARLALGITANPTNAPIAGTAITFTYTLTNTGNAPITLPSPYLIAWTIKIGTGTPAAQTSFDCATPISSIPINSSTTCTGTSSFTTTAVAGNILNTAIAPATNAPAATGTVTVTTNFLCSLTHSATGNPSVIPNPSGANAQTTWSIYNKTASVVHITSITVFWYNTGFDFKNVSLGGTAVWTGTTNATGFTITSGTPSNPVTTLTWPLTVNANSSTPMVLRFSGITNSVRVFLAFSESSCSAGLDSANVAQQGTWP